MIYNPVLVLLTWPENNQASYFSLKIPQVPIDVNWKMFPFPLLYMFLGQLGYWESAVEGQMEPASQISTF